MTGTAKEQPKKHGAEHLKKYQWPKGVSGNPDGRGLSPTTRIRQMFKKNPEKFDEWLEEYLEDKNNRKHVVEMLDGKPTARHEFDGKVQVSNFDEEQVKKIAERFTRGVGGNGVLRGEE